MLRVYSENRPLALMFASFLVFALISYAISLFSGVSGEMVFILFTVGMLVVALVVPEVVGPTDGKKVDFLYYTFAVIGVTVFFLASARERLQIQSDLQTIRVENEIRKLENTIMWEGEIAFENYLKGRYELGRSLQECIDFHTLNSVFEIPQGVCNRDVGEAIEYLLRDEGAEPVSEDVFIDRFSSMPTNYISALQGARSNSLFNGRSLYEAIQYYIENFVTLHGRGEAYLEFKEAMELQIETLDQEREELEDNFFILNGRSIERNGVAVRNVSSNIWPYFLVFCLALKLSRSSISSVFLRHR